MRLNHADVTVRLPYAVSNGKCGVRSGLLDQKEISRFIANSPELAGIRACILSLQAGDRIEGEFGAFVSALQATPRFDDNPCACRRCTLDRPISGGPANGLLEGDCICLGTRLGKRPHERPQPFALLDRLGSPVAIPEVSVPGTAWRTRARTRHASGTVYARESPGVGMGYQRARRIGAPRAGRRHRGAGHQVGSRASQTIPGD